MLLRRLREAIEEMAQRHKKKKAEKEKMKRRSRKYGQAQLKHSRRGMRSTFLGVCCLFLLVLAFFRFLHIQRRRGPSHRLCGAVCPRAGGGRA